MGHAFYRVGEFFERSRRKEWRFGLTDSGRERFAPLVTFTAGRSSREALREDGCYEIRLEKIGRRVTVWIDTFQLFQFNLPPDMAEEFAKSPISVHVWSGDAWAGRDHWGGPWPLGMKVSVVELVVSKKLTPWQPPKPSPARSR